MSKIIKNIIVLLSIFAMSVTPLSAMAKDSNYVVNIKSNFTQKLFENNTSNKEIKGLLALLELAHIIDDAKAHTLVAASTMEKDILSKVEKTANIEGAKAVGTAIAEKALAKGIDTVVFDRGGYLYHGRIEALADAAREAGLKF